MAPGTDFSSVLTGLDRGITDHLAELVHIIHFPVGGGRGRDVDDIVRVVHHPTQEARDARHKDIGIHMSDVPGMIGGDALLEIRQDGQERLSHLGGGFGEFRFDLVSLRDERFVFRVVVPPEKGGVQEDIVDEFAEQVQVFGAGAEEKALDLAHFFLFDPEGGKQFVGRSRQENEEIEDVPVVSGEVLAVYRTVLRVQENEFGGQPREHCDPGLSKTLLVHRVEERQRITSEGRQLGMDIQDERSSGVRFEGVQAAGVVRYLDDGGIPLENGFHIRPEGFTSGENDSDWHRSKGSMMLLRNR